MTATVIRHHLLNCQVCVPADWTDSQIVELAENSYPCGTSMGWQIRRAGDKLLAGAPERVGCESLPAHVHVMLDA